MGWESRGPRLREIGVVACYPTHKQSTAGIPNAVRFHNQVRDTVLSATGFRDITSEKNGYQRLHGPIVSGGSKLMLLASGKLEELIVRRKSLFEEFEKNPQRLHLSLEIKIIDDQIAECNEQIRLEKNMRTRFTK
jgi:hypothetical protein